MVVVYFRTKVGCAYRMLMTWEDIFWKKLMVLDILFYLGATKMFHNLKEVYWLNNLKKDIAEFVAKCPNYQQVKAEHLRP